MSKATVICGLGYGDEGKGTTVDWLARRERVALVVRYNGGAQAAHNVVAGERHHTFAQLGSASFSGVPTLLSRFVLVNPLSLFAEACGFGEGALDLVRVERDALVTTPFHVAANRLREMARTGRHGSCGMGIGETTADFLEVGDEVLRVRDLADPVVTRRKLESLRARKIASLEDLPYPRASRERDVLFGDRTIELALDAYGTFARRVSIVDASFLPRELAKGGHVVFEGAQGVLLDQDFGFQPYTTWTDITFANAMELLSGFGGEVVRLGVLRAYMTRHGNGPFVSEDPALCRLSAHDHNGWSEWQHGFRSGAYDEVATRYALDVLRGVDALAMTNLDRLDLVDGDVPIVTAYEGATDATLFESPSRIRVKRPLDLAHQEALTCALLLVRPVYERLALRGLAYAEMVASRLGVPLAMASFGPRAEDKLAL
ncbi:MAG TPA: adenylosuccinate synthetase [Labilithrix sp.]|nr:adenylosuccinate synthetase [Labilithrix sp.]